MIDLFNMSFDAIAISFLTCMVLREIFLVTLPSESFLNGGPRG